MGASHIRGVGHHGGVDPLEHARLHQLGLPHSSFLCRAADDHDTQLLRIEIRSQGRSGEQARGPG